MSSSRSTMKSAVLYLEMNSKRLKQINIVWQVLTLWGLCPRVIIKQSPVPCTSYLQSSPLGWQESCRQWQIPSRKHSSTCTYLHGSRPGLQGTHTDIVQLSARELGTTSCLLPRNKHPGEGLHGPTLFCFYQKARCRLLSRGFKTGELQWWKCRLLFRSPKAFDRKDPFLSGCRNPSHQTRGYQAPTSKP